MASTTVIEEMDTGELTLRSELRRLIGEFFSEDDLRTAVFDIGVDWDNLAGKTKEIKIQNMIIHLENRGLLYRLIGHCQKERPQVDWTGFG